MGPNDHPDPDVSRVQGAYRPHRAKRREEPVKDPGERPDQTGGRGLPPMVVFLVLMGIIAVIVGLAIATGDFRSDRGPNVDSESGFVLTNAEAIDRYDELHDLSLLAFRRRDLSLLAQIYTPDSPTLERVRSEIQTLIDDSVTVRPRFTTLSIRVVSNQPSEIVLEESRISDAKFVNSDGEDITEDRQPERQVVQVTLRGTNDGWFIYRSLITKAEPTTSSKA
jgi:hypothetical protein